ncbi:MAG TPA: hypothetical protein VHJ20_01915 [Polyangia bacterium]|nr:hypothetical protein [Polyangia bacterium]
MGRAPSDNRRPANATGTRAAFVWLMVAAAPGCSFLFSEGAPDDHARRATFSCGSSLAPPVLDTIGTGIYSLSLLGQVSAKDPDVVNDTPSQQADRRRERNVAIGVTALIAALDAASAIYGYHAVASCREAQGERALEIAHAQVLPPPYGLPPYGAPPPVWPPPAAPPPATPSP